MRRLVVPYRSGVSDSRVRFGATVTVRESDGGESTYRIDLSNRPIESTYRIVGWMRRIWTRAA
ncbi:MAG: hypothetical protein EXS30_11200 [Pedosphaera sp.]|nr:hypothetical protein [Pedosphaera sp.]